MVLRKGKTWEGPAAVGAVPSSPSEGKFLGIGVSYAKRHSHGDPEMYGNRVSKSGKRVSEAKMTSVALSEAKGWYAALMNAEFKGRGDREKAVRGRLADKTGIPESYLYRLQYKTREMRDIAGSAYRALMLAHMAYEEVCLRNEEAAAKHRTERHALRKAHATADKRSGESVGMGEASK